MHVRRSAQHRRRQRARGAPAPGGRAFFYDQDRKTRAGDRGAAARRASSTTTSSAPSSSAWSASASSPARSRAQLRRGPRPRAERAAWLAKADLLTGMVGEFPELQGIMGRYYARHDGEDASGRRARSRRTTGRASPATRCPRTASAAAVALADKLDTLVGIFGIGQRAHRRQGSVRRCAAPALGRAAHPGRARAAAAI